MKKIVTNKNETSNWAGLKSIIIDDWRAPKKTEQHKSTAPYFSFLNFGYLQFWSNVGQVNVRQ